MQRLGSHVFELMLMMINLSLQMNSATQGVYIVVSVRLGSLDVGMCILKLVFNTKQQCQVVVNPK